MVERSHVVAFVDDSARKEYDELPSTAENWLKPHIDRAFDWLKQDPFCGVAVPKRQIPVEYRCKGADNLWKYNLPNAWRLLYFVTADQVTIVAVVLEWLDHKSYEKKFGYRVQ